MIYALHPPTKDLGEAVAVLESLGIFGATRKEDGSLRLYSRRRTRVDPTTGEKVEFRPSSLMNMDIRKELEESGWIVVNTTMAYQWPEIWRG